MNVAKLAGLPVCKRSAMMGEVFVAGCCGPTRRANVGAFRAAIGDLFCFTYKGDHQTGFHGWDLYDAKEEYARIGKISLSDFLN